MNRVSRDSIVEAVERHLSADLGKDKVLYQLDTGNCYTLNAVGICLWRHLQEPLPMGVLLERLLEAFDVPPGQLEQDLLELLEDLVREGLVRVVSSAQFLHPTVPGTSRMS